MNESDLRPRPSSIKGRGGVVCRRTGSETRERECTLGVALGEFQGASAVRSPLLVPSAHVSQEWEVYCGNISCCAVWYNGS